MLAGALAAGAGLLVSRGASASAGNGLQKGLENDPGQWNTYVDPGGVPEGSIEFPPPRVVASPERSGESLELSIAGGHRPYTHLMGYRDLPYVAAEAFELSCHWRFTDTTMNNQGGASTVQAVELAINVWSETNRFEWALQWQNVLDGSAEEGSSPAWRLWDGTTWINTGFAQELAPNAWHAFKLRGVIRDGMAQYVSFRSDDLSERLENVFPPGPPMGEPRCNVAFQLDGNYQQDAYACLFDRVNLKWWNTSPW